MYSDNWNYATEAVKSDDFSSDFSQVVDSFTEVPRQQLWIPALAEIQNSVWDQLMTKQDGEAAIII